jgi:hypothetical protein
MLLGQDLSEESFVLAATGTVCTESNPSVPQHTHTATTPFLRRRLRSNLVVARRATFKSTRCSPRGRVLSFYVTIRAPKAEHELKAGAEHELLQLEDPPKFLALKKSILK